MTTYDSVFHKMQELPPSTSGSLCEEDVRIGSKDPVTMRLRPK